ncbi:hypothetical protein EJ08DRAFT_693879 [Tothia fuscella]|uniref:Monooxygenase n=1 Tax=Tothia fuscella TaxID=1048955 RepID=A0A9P4U2A0_9PEZI|nr:hypothetical protein EJ08DRAFT_693879 [Tothia fuscella]
MEHFKSLAPTTDNQEPSQSTKAHSRAGHFSSTIKEQLQLSSWLAIGACLNAILFLAIGRLAFTFPVLLITYRFGDALLQAWGLKKTPYMEGSIMQKYSAQLPNADGTFGPKPANQQIVVFLIGARCNHPMGILAPGYKELGEYFYSMQKDVEASAEKYGFLGGSDWTATGERATGNHLLTVMYFKNSEGLHAFAHDSLHRDG